MTVGNRRRASSHLPTSLTWLFDCVATADRHETLSAGTHPGSKHRTCCPIDCALSGPQALGVALAHLLVQRILPISRLPECTSVLPQFSQGCFIEWIAA
jgi:hypothetical protein